VTLNAAEDTVTWTVTHTVAGANAAHIHNGLAFANGPVVFAFAGAASPIMGTSAITATQVADLKAGRYYVNVHSPANPGGEIRGQLLRTGEQLFRTSLAGANEVPPVTTTATGGVQVIVSADMTKVNCLGTFTGVTATVAHIHRAPAGMNGGVVIPFVVGTGTISCTDSAITTTNLADLTGGNWYANVHSAANPGGEIRGQLAQP
jgi:hypothetical protein